MDIKYSETKDLTPAELESLFLSVDWESGRYPDLLCTAMRNSHRVCTAWHEGRLVGLLNSLSDGVMNAYFQYMLVHPDYQQQGVGRGLMRRMLDGYAHLHRKALIAYDSAVGFYESMGFEAGGGKHPMFLSEL
ncbi:GNAT family N-acetyltransferase [Salidesulfovibrio onnuriiensis]|uniref:GNAT family N-acetyltransferase n=1 Tax=Salidesulfovibrio onnuriiensis TaxID=2583823 RepID=UPI0011CCB16C|nr:GNAT family N-acetyltransferase [Salidesulfovibrio onnuriiensis]